MRLGGIIGNFELEKLFTHSNDFGTQQELLKDELQLNLKQSGLERLQF